MSCARARRRAAVFVVAALPALALVPSAARAGDATTDCFPDRVAALVLGPVSAPPAFNSWQPGILLGPPGNATPTSGSLAVLALGHGGSAVLEFTDNVIVDGPGPDFVVFENPFFCTAVPPTDTDPYSVFAEPGIVEASEDGVTFHRFPFDAAALSEVVSQCTDKALLRRLGGLMGLTPSFTGNYTLPDDPLVFDPAAPGGISGHGGDAFDLAAVGLEKARFVRIVDPDLAISIPGSAEGVDLDTVVALHSAPVLGAGFKDGDGDGLSDDAETFLYGTDPSFADTDGDGVSDGEEAARCRSPRSTAADPFFVPAIDVSVDGASTVARWNFLGSGVTYDVIRGGVRALRSIGGMTDLGVVLCVEDNSTDLTTRTVPDATTPAAGEAFFYLVRQNPAGSGQAYGTSSAHEPRVPASGDCR